MKRFTIDLAKGVHDGAESSVLGNGWLTSCRNWVPEPTGGVRARRGWVKASSTGAPTTRKCVGLGYFTRLITPGTVQRSDVASAAGASVAPRWKQPTVAGSLLVLVVSIAKGTTSTINTPAGWTQAVQSGDGAGLPRCAIFYKPNAASESGAVTVTATSAGAMAAQLLEVSGITITSPLDQTASTSAAADATPDSGTTAATTQAVEFVIAALADEALEAQTNPTNGFQQISETQVSGTPSVTMGVYFKTTTATGTQSMSATTATANDVAGAIATFKGWFTASPSAGQTAVTELVEAIDATTAYEFYAVDIDNLGSDTWSLIGSISVSDPTKLVAMAPGFGRLFITNPQLASSYTYDGESLAAITGSPAGRFVVLHNQRVWVGGTDATPGVLYFSEVGNYGSWDTTNDNLVLEGEAGEPIEDGAPFGDGLVLAKRTSLWFLTGNDRSDFALQRLSDAGAAPGRTVMPTSIGVIVAGRKQVWLWDGSMPDSISKPIESSYGLTGSWMSVARQDNVVYILDQGSGTMWCLDLVSGSWHTETLGSGNDAPSALYNYDHYLFAGPRNATSAWGTILAYRSFPGTARDKDFDTLSETFQMRTADIALAGPSYGLAPQMLHFRLRQRGGTAQSTGLTLTPYYDGVAQDPIAIDPKPAAGIYAERLRLPPVGFLSTFGFEVSQTVPSGEHALFDIEEPLLECDIQETV